MTVSEAEPSVARAPPALLDQLEQWLGALSRVVAIACVCGMLFVAAVIMVDVVLRWIANEPIPAVNEIVQMTFSVAIAACIPAGMMQRVNLKIDLVARYFSPRSMPGSRRWAARASGCSTARSPGGIWLYADALALDGKARSSWDCREAPFMYAVSALFAFGVVLQAVIVLNDAAPRGGDGRGRHSGRRRGGWPRSQRSAWLWSPNVDTIATWAQTMSD